MTPTPSNPPPHKPAPDSTDATSETLPTDGKTTVAAPATKAKVTLKSLSVPVNVPGARKGPKRGKYG